MEIYFIHSFVPVRCLPQSWIRAKSSAEKRIIMKKNLKKIMVTSVSGLLAAGLLVGSVDYASHMFVLTNRAVA